MWADNETTQDLIGFQVHADLIRSIVTDSSLLPITIGLFGDWGGGKTSIMRMLQRDLDPEIYPENSPEREKLEGTACLYFNGWLFEGYDDAKSALLSSILLELSEHKRFGPKVKDKAAALLKSVDWMRLARLGFKEVALPALLAYLTGGVSLLPSIAASTKRLAGYESEKGAPAADKEPILNWEEYLTKDDKPGGPMDVRTFRDRFSKMLSDSDISALVVLIDDLDRCSPHRIIENLEAIKLFLNVDKTAFVIGADPRIVRHAIATVYRPDEISGQRGELDSPTDIVTDYLEKLIQLPYRLPRLSPAEVQTYMSLLFCRRDLPPEKFELVYNASQEHRAKDRYSVYGYGAIRSVIETDISTDLLNSLSFCTSVSPLITDGLKGNPRQVKRFLNAFVVRKKLADVAKLINIRDDVLVKLMVLEYAHPNQLNELFQWQSADNGYPKKLTALEQALLPPSGNVDDEEAAKAVNPEWATQSMRRWIVMEPRLSEVDLRDYFWVARDRLQSTLSNVAMVPPVIRRLVEDLISDNKAKHQAAKESIQIFEADERDLVLSLLSNHIERNQDDKTGYEAFRLLIEWDIPGSITELEKALQAVPSEKIPVPFGLSLINLQKGKPEVAGALEPIISRLAASETPIGKVVMKHLRKG